MTAPDAAEGRVRLELAPPVAVLTFDRPRSLNAFTSAMVDQFAVAVAELAAREDIRAVLVTGAAGAFTTGADQREVAARLDRNFGEWLSRTVADTLDALEALDAFTVAVVNGPAYGAGAEILLACDYRITEAPARIAFMQSRNGLVPAWGGGPRLVRELGERRALGVLLSARVLSAEDALRLGLVDVVVAPGEGLAEANRVAADVATRAPEVVQALRRVVRQWGALPPAEAREAEFATFISLWGGPAHRAATGRWRQPDR